MKLYYSAGSCSTSCHIVLEESGLPYEAIEIDWDNEADPNVALVLKLNPLGTVPVFITDEGKQLDQNISIHTYVADKSKKLLPPAGTVERAEAMNYLSFVAADLHKSVGGLFGVPYVSPDKNLQEAFKNYTLTRVGECLSYLNSKLENKDYLMGKDFSPADAYAFVVTGWCRLFKIPLTPYKNIEAFLKRVANRPAVAKVLKAEGLA